jgi:hypothetical protein
MVTPETVLSWQWQLALVKYVWYIQINTFAISDIKIYNVWFLGIRKCINAESCAVSTY